MKTNRFLNFFIAAVWIANGLFCKVLDLVPRHQEIVARILGEGYARELTVLIGCLEIAMAIWILSGIRARWCATVQLVVIVTMNTLEFILVPDLLLWGKLNALFAFLFTLLIYSNAFHIDKKLVQQT